MLPVFIFVVQQTSDCFTVLGLHISFCAEKLRKYTSCPDLQTKCWVLTWAIACLICFSNFFSCFVLFLFKTLTVCAELRVYSLLSCRCVSVKVFKSKPPQYPVPDLCGQLSISHDFHGGLFSLGSWCDHRLFYMCFKEKGSTDQRTVSHNPFILDVNATKYLHTWKIYTWTNICLAFITFLCKYVVSCKYSWI